MFRDALVSSKGPFHLNIFFSRFSEPYLLLVLCMTCFLYYLFKWYSHREVMSVSYINGYDFVDFQLEII